ncbi:substrate-binding domain-containing protein, partial [Streptomyces sp. NPDC048279]|uniref:substrate-binding domain-containing protein n=1 Tax=Streptomyces sp. NPDC048279 TaxID=3154714 RepID=UPI003426E543
STAGIRDLDSAGTGWKKRGSPPDLALSDGPKPPDMPELRENRVALVIFALVVNDDVPLTNLSTADIRRLYRGEITDWKQLGGPDLPVHLVSRDANSGTRQVFQRRVLKRGEIANSSVDCVHKDDPTAKVIRCELDSTDQVLDEVAQLKGAVGYAELNVAAGAKGLHTLAIDHHIPSVEAIEGGLSPYPYREIEYAYTYGHTTMGALLEACRRVTGSAAELRWTGPEVVLAAGIEPWVQLPVWVPPGSETYDAVHRMDVSRAVGTGLVCRPAEETVADTWEWLRETGGEVPVRADRPAVGLAPEVEARALGLPAGGP